MNELTLSNGSGGRVPNFAAFGLKFKEAQKHAEKLDEIWRRQKDAGREQQAAQDRIRALEEETRGARARAILGGGGDPDETPLVDARRRVESLQQEIQDLRRAAEYGHANLVEAVVEGGGEHRAKLAAAMDREAEEVAALEADLAARRHALEAKLALDRWLESPEGGFAVAPQGQGVAA
jgi:DNA repair exonuclease SbcCD ATPase subunit